MPPPKLGQVIIQREALACTIYAKMVDPDKPMLNKACAAAAFKAADDFIEYFEENEKQDSPAQMEDMKQAVITMLQGNPHYKIPAIKEVRTRTGWGLKEAKDYVDKLINEEPILTAQYKPLVVKIAED